MSPQFVLNVSNDEAGRYAVTRTLEAAGFTLRECADGNSCLEFLLRHGHETLAIILDIQLPDIHGFEVTRRIRKQWPQPRIPIVHLSAKSLDLKDRIQGLEAGANYYLISPVDGDELIAVLRSLLQQREYESGVLQELMLVTEKGQASEHRGMLNERDRLFNLSPDLMAITDTNGVFRAVNPAWEQILGYSVEDLINHPFISFIHPDDVAATCDVVRTLEETGQVKDFVNRYRRSDGTYRHLMWTAVVNDSVTYAMARDITERLKADLHASQLQKLEAIGQLAGGIAHDFNNLLMVILSYSQLICDRLDGDNQIFQYTSQIMKASKRAAELTQQLLAYSRKQVLEPRVFVLNNFVSETVRLVKRTLGEHIEVQFETASSAMIEVDPGQLTQVILNLAINARDAMPSGGTLRFEVDDAWSRDFSLYPALPKDQSWVRLSVIDTGIGISPEILPHIFEPFFTTKEPGKGTGLGLATVYGIVKQSGGYCYVDAKHGSGTRFDIYFPASTARVAEDTDNKPKTTGLENATIMLVEDDEALGNVLMETLVSDGYDVHRASNGVQAIELANRLTTPVRLLITDVVMPHLGGKEVAAELKRRWPDLKVLFMSGYTEQQIFEGLGELLRKPFSLQVLRTKVMDALARDKS